MVITDACHALIALFESGSMHQRKHKKYPCPAALPDKGERSKISSTVAKLRRA